VVVEANVGKRVLLPSIEILVGGPIGHEVVSILELEHAVEFEILSQSAHLASVVGSGH
jgi:hypothetical protein